MHKKESNEDVNWSWFHKFAGILMPSNYYTFNIFSKIIDENPWITKIIELGTHTGSMSVALGLEGVRKGIEVHTFELNEQVSEETKRILDRLGVKRHLCNIFDDHQFIKSLFKDGPVYLLCDNGSKAVEFQEFVPKLKSGSVVSVHDWTSEIHQHDIDPYKHMIDPFHEDDWMRHNVQLATWRIK
jgi:predicted O-methyltransferase YrrM